MSGIVWLASYPKSGNTWTRALIVNALRGRDEPVPINALATGGIASGRQVFDELTLLASSLLTHDEADRLRPAVHRAHALSHAAAEMRDDRAEDLETARLAARFVKVHDAWTLNDRGEPVLGGARAAQIAILIVRDPRAVAPSLANHLGCSIDEAIERMGDPSYVFSGGGRKRPATRSAERGPRPPAPPHVSTD